MNRISLHGNVDHIVDAMLIVLQLGAIDELEELDRINEGENTEDTDHIILTKPINMTFILSLPHVSALRLPSLTSIESVRYHSKLFLSLMTPPRGRI